MRRKSQNRTSAISALEQRQLLSGGNVQTTFVGGTLTITGDNAANEVVIEQTNLGLVVRASGGTKLNGTTNGQLTFLNPSQTNINLKGGNDLLTFGDVPLGGVSVQMGAGNDRVSLSGINADGDLVIDLGAGNDVFTASKSHVNGNFMLLCGAGNDRLEARGLMALGNLTLDAGAGNDAVHLKYVWMDGTASIQLGSGNDVFLADSFKTDGQFSLNAGTGDDLVVVAQSEFQQSVLFDLGAGNDALMSGGTSIDANLAPLTSDGGTGNDTLYSSDRTVTGFEILTPTEAQVQTLIDKLRLTFPS